MTKIMAKQIIEMLADKHSKDVFVPEAKTGSSWAGAQRLDAWAMKRSWSPLTMVGYEVKISRQDFLNDNKWRGYLDSCHEFYFVCPPGVVEKEELPDGIGLMITSKNGTRLYTKRKAIRREDINPVELMAYVLMSRCRITRNMYDNQLTGMELCKKWLENKREREEIGYRVGKAVGAHIERVEKENYDLKRENLSLHQTKKQIEELGGTDRIRLMSEGILVGKHFKGCVRNIHRLIHQLDDDLGE